MAKEQAAAEQPDVLSRLLPQGCHGLLEIVADDGDLRVVTLAKRAREHKRLHAGHGARLLFAARHPLKRAAADKNRVELVEKGLKVDLRVHDDPVGLALGPGDKAVQTGRYLVANASHGRLPQLASAVVHLGLDQFDAIAKRIAELKAFAAGDRYPIENLDSGRR